MKVILILAVLLPISALVAWGVARQALAATRRRRRISELEDENARLDALNRNWLSGRKVRG